VTPRWSQERGTSCKLAQPVGPFVPINGRLDGHTLLRAGLKPGISVIDIGANRGGFSSALRAVVPGTYHAVEANPELIPSLEGGLYDSVRHCAVTDGATSATLHTAQNDQASSILSLEESVFDATDAIEVPGRSLDSVLEQFPGFLDVVKVDIEGAEIAALRTLSAETARRIGQMTVEFHCADVFGFGSDSERDAADTIATLQSRGFLPCVFAPYKMDVLFVNREHFRISDAQAYLWRGFAGSTRAYVAARHSLARLIPPARRKGWGWYQRSRRAHGAHG